MAFKKISLRWARAGASAGLRTLMTGVIISSLPLPLHPTTTIQTIKKMIFQRSASRVLKMPRFSLVLPLAFVGKNPTLEKASTL